MAKRTKKEEKHIHNHYYHPNWTKLIIYIVVGMISFLLLANLTAEITAKISENRYAHYNCLSACKEKGFSGYQRGFDGFPGSCEVKEFDRTRCVMDCNDMYLKLRTKHGGK